MPIELHELVKRSHTAVVTHEMQRGVIGPESWFPELAQVVEEARVIPATARLLRAARAVGLPVVHCVVEFRADWQGSAANSPLLSMIRRRSGHLQEGTSAAELVPGLGVEPSDITSSRRHGVSGFIGTSLDPTLRNLGVRTVVLTGVAVNLGILGTAIEAVDSGYQVVVATDAVAGFPADYAAEILAKTISLLATRATVDELIKAWTFKPER